MNKTLVIFPHQLHQDHLGLNHQPKKIYLIEDSLFFMDDQYPVNFHWQKLVFHRASMQYYAEFLRKQGYTVEYQNFKPEGLTNLFHNLSGTDVMLADSVDFALNKRIKKLANQYNVNLQWLRSQLFINSNQDNTDYRKNKKRWFMADFYQFQRKRLNVLVSDNKPIGGKWSFDEENRKKIPKKERHKIPKLSLPDNNNAFVNEACKYVKQHFPNVLGNNNHSLFYPITHQDAEQWLDNFLTTKFELFGPYEDALVPNEHWLYHSILTPLLNTGLLSVELVVEKTLNFGEEHKIPIASLEGFIRQIIGWREFMRATYIDLGVTMRTTNHWQHKRKLADVFYTAKTGIKPIDDVIEHVLNTGYCHHIERLMVLGGFMFLCEIDPDEIYRWFMELFVDSYDWVMVPNVYAMSQNADGGLITTKPYFSGSSYVKKMGYDITTADQSWVDIWDGLYWRWIWLHHDQLSQNPRWAMMCAMAKKMDEEKRAKHIANAEAFLQKIDSC